MSKQWYRFVKPDIFESFKILNVPINWSLSNVYRSSRTVRKMSVQYSLDAPAVLWRRKTFFTVDILICHSWKSTGDVQWTILLYSKVMKTKWDSSIINVLISLVLLLLWHIKMSAEKKKKSIVSVYISQLELIKWQTVNIMHYTIQ